MAMSNILTPAQIAGIEARDKARTQGEWKWHFLGRSWLLWCDGGMRKFVLDAFKGKLRVRDMRLDVMLPFYPTHPDADFVAHASIDIPALLASHAALVAFVWSMAEGDCTYGDNCPDKWHGRHGYCHVCQSREVLGVTAEQALDINYARASLNTEGTT